MERDSYSLFFSSGGGGVGKFGFQNRLGAPPDSVGKLIRTGFEPTTTDTHIKGFSSLRGRTRGHMALFSLEYTLISIISKEVGENMSVVL